MIKKFKNSAEKTDVDWIGQPLRPGSYGYRNMSKYLYMWGGTIQKGVAQCGTYLLTGKWMSNPSNYAIFKCEGGCKIEGVGELVLTERSCYFDCYGRTEEQDEQLSKLRDMITNMVLEFDPMNPQSIVDSFAKSVNVDPEVVLEKLCECDTDGVFGGNALSSFFDHNPFSESPMFKIQGYEKWIRINFLKEDKAEVKEDLRIKNLSRKLLNEMQEALRNANTKGTYISTPMCCSPSQHTHTVKYWINTGRSTCIDGWKTEEEIRSFIKKVKSEGLEFYLKSDTSKF